MGSDLLRTTMMVGVGGSLVSVGLLVIDHFLGKRASRRACAAILVILVLLTGWCFFRGLEFRSWWPLPLFAVGFLFGALGHVQDFERLLARIIRPRLVWVGLLLICVVSANVAAFSFSHPEPTNVFGGQQFVNYRLADKPSSEKIGLTRKGQEIALYNYFVHGEDGEEITYGLKVLDLAVADKYRHHIIRLNDPDSLSNCHGFVFADNKYALDEIAVENILADNEYQVVDVPQSGDVVIYRGPDNLPMHSGVVRDTRGTVLVESKWGPLGVYLHQADISPYGFEYEYYRAPFPNHSIDFGDASDRKEPVE